MTDRYPRLSRVGLLTLLAFGLAGPAPSSSLRAADDPRKIAWRDDLAGAQAEAKSRDLLLWIQVTGPWCINCRRMDRTTFAHAAVVTESRERFIPVKLRSDEYENLAQSLGLTSLPATVIVRPDGEVVDKFEGYGEPEHFEGFLATTLRHEGRSPEQVAAKQAQARADAEVALAGYSPVSLIQDRKLVPGKAELTVEHDGRVFRFASEAEQAAFRRRPGSFAPVNDGRCPVSQVDQGDLLAGDPRWGVVYRGHLFLFKDAPGRDRFARDPERYAHVNAAERGSCSHCRTHSKLAGRPTLRSSPTDPVPDIHVLAPSRLEAFLMPDDTVRR